MVIVSLVAAGVGLAIDKYTERRTRKEDSRRHNSDDQIDGVIARISTEEERQQREREAFNELQGYADFQNDLSSQVLDDIANEDTGSAYSGLGQSPIDYGSSRTSQYPSLQTGKLKWPIIIPQQDVRNGDASFVRAYPRPLLDCGIDQTAFLNVLDSFVVHMKLSTRLEAVNIAKTASPGVAWQDVPETFSRAIPVAVRVMKAYQRDRKSNSFLNHVNALTFKPRGLFAMIITSRPDSPSQVITIDVPSTTTPAPQFIKDVEMSLGYDNQSSYATPSLYTTASSSSTMLRPTNSMDVDTTPSHDMQSMYQQSTTGSGHSARPGTSAGRNTFSSLLAKHRERRSEASNKRARKEIRPGSRADSLAAALESPSSSNTFQFNCPGEVSSENISMESTALYLVIVNDPDAPMYQPSKVMTPQREAYRYPTAPTMAPIMGEKGKRVVGGSMVQQPVATTSSLPRKMYYDPVYDAPRGAPPAYSPG